MRADFYLIDKPRFREQPLLLVCELCRRALAEGAPTLVLVRDSAQAEALDELLWEFDPDTYLPHQIAGIDEDDEITPLLIVPPGTDYSLRQVVINLRDTPVPAPCPRVLEIVPPDPEARAPLRERWRAYQASGYALSKHDI